MIWIFLTRPFSSVSLIQEEHNQTIPHQTSPTAWRALYADRYTCQVTLGVLVPHLTSWMLHCTLIHFVSSAFVLLQPHLQDSAVIPAHADLAFTVLLLNTDSAGNPLEHFSAEEAGREKICKFALYLCIQTAAKMVLAFPTCWFVYLKYMP